VHRTNNSQEFVKKESVLCDTTSFVASFVVWSGPLVPTLGFVDLLS
jgi:hypothetical protein